MSSRPSRPPFARALIASLALVALVLKHGAAWAVPRGALLTAPQVVALLRTHGFRGPDPLRTDCHRWPERGAALQCARTSRCLGACQQRLTRVYFTPVNGAYRFERSESHLVETGACGHCE